MLGTSTFSRRDDCGGVTWHVHVIYAREHKYRVLAVTVLALARAAPFLIRLRLVGKRASGY